MILRGLYPFSRGFGAGSQKAHFVIWAASQNPGLTILANKAPGSMLTTPSESEQHARAVWRGTNLCAWLREKGLEHAALHMVACGEIFSS